MLEKVPKAVGRALQSVHASAADLAVAHSEITGTHATIELSSPAFAYNEPIPSTYTADGLGFSPPLQWDGIPGDAASLVLMIEDADSPTPKPMVHAIAWNIPARDATLGPGALGDSALHGGVATLGRNSFLKERYAPPDPPPGHGPHRYVFQIFALDVELHFREPPGRTAVMEAMKGHVLAKGLHIGTYERP
jgi:Raf kinase inhibitor-like YbhB/YbcL family protein